MARRNGGIGTWIVALLIFVIVFWVVVEHFANPYTPPQQILTQFFDGLWDQFIAAFISVFGLTFTALLIAIMASVLYVHSKNKGRW